MFISLEGGEGVGKSTLIKALADRAAKKVPQVIRTREPGGTPLAEKVREIALHPPGRQKLSALCEALLMNAARADHLDKVIRPALSRGTWVFCDRFSDSTRVYQSVGGGVSKAFLVSLEAEVVAGDKPDLTLILDAAPEDLQQRRLARNQGGDAFEAMDMKFHEAVRQGFLEIAQVEPERCVVLDALLSPDDLAAKAWRHIQDRNLDALVRTS